MKDIKKKVGNFFDNINEKPILVCIFSAIIINFINEVLSRRSFGLAVGYVVEHPGTFLMNVLIIFVTMLLALLVKRRLFIITVVSLFWLIMGVANYVVLSYRVTPFSAVDFKLFKSVFTIVNQYLNKTELVLIILLLGIFICGCVFLWFKVPKRKGKQHFLASLVLIVAVAGCAYGIKDIGNRTGRIPKDLGNISFAYDQCGFVYCFVNSIFDVGIEKPLNYSVNTMAGIMGEINDTKSGSITNRPNIIFVQLESFYDPNYMKKYSYNLNPVPNYDRLKNGYSSGFLTVPAFGAGTANTEFEIMSGMSLDYFGFCEYPYKTILKDSTCESICYDLDEIGYTSHAVHNNRGNFYSRNTVFKKLGYDDFVSVEYMNNLEYNDIGWVKDDVLIGTLLDTMQATPNQDFIYTITVQSHGKYPEDADNSEKPIHMYGELDEATKNSYEYYLNEIHEVDAFIGQLTATLENYDERCVVVFYGDHLPTFDITNEDLINGDTFQTEYVIWNNFGLRKNDRNLLAYQLSSYVMQQLGFNNGILTKYHQTCWKQEDYQTNLELLQYDMLYGQKYVYGGTSPFESKATTMGAYPITISEVMNLNGDIVVVGDRFTEASMVYINGNKMDTRLQKGRYLIVDDEQLKEGDRVRVKQVTDTGKALSKTEEYIYMPNVVDTEEPLQDQERQDNN